MKKNKNVVEEISRFIAKRQVLLARESEIMDMIPEHKRNLNLNCYLGLAYQSNVVLNVDDDYKNLNLTECKKLEDEDVFIISEFIESHTFKTIHEWGQEGRRISVDPKHAYVAFKTEKDKSITPFSIFEKCQTKPNKKEKRPKRSHLAKEMTEAQKEVGKEFLRLVKIDTPAAKKLLKDSEAIRTFEISKLFQTLSYEFSVNIKTIFEFIKSQKNNGKVLKDERPPVDKTNTPKNHNLNPSKIAMDFETTKIGDYFTHVVIRLNSGKADDFFATPEFAKKLAESFGMEVTVKKVELEKG